jgi:2-keto-4-pentenoate hydratase/2-oxohepta-3-ene-1,7-dioic acid hydratase in catechol pathway
MIGTPAGVDFFRKEFLSHGNVVEVEIGGLATARDEIRFQ